MDANIKSEKKKLVPLKITCTSTACADGLHCFRQAKKLGEERVTGGRCRECGADLVEFQRVHNRKLEDLAYTLTSLQRELIRHHFWHLEFDARAINYARRKGATKLYEAAEKRLRNSVGSAEPWRDGAQTPIAGNPIYYAQHATATCCRKCIEYWHGLERGRELSDDELEYLTSLVRMFLEARLPNLPEDGRTIPAIRRSRATLDD